MNTPCATSDLLVFSHLSWGEALKGPQQVMSKFAQFRRVYFVETAIVGMTQEPRIHIQQTLEGVSVVVPYVPSGLGQEEMDAALRDLLDGLIFDEDIKNPVLWYFTPKTLGYTRQLDAEAIIFDLMDGTGALDELEKELCRKADAILTSSAEFFDAKKTSYDHLHLMADDSGCKLTPTQFFALAVKLEKSIQERRPGNYCQVTGRQITSGVSTSA